MTIGKLTRVPLRKVWNHEALDFTTWLEENTDVLNEILELNLVSVEREKSAGDFSVDLVGEDDAGNTVIIENQLERSDHDHLGKVLTYLAALDAKAAVWIVAQPRPEHVKAIAWLNEATSTPFYLVQVEAVRIGDSPPAPLLTRIVGPSEEARAAGAARKEMSERHEIRYRFWTRLLEAAKAKTKLHAGISPGAYNWIGTGSGVRGLNLNYAVRQHETQVELYIDRGDADENTATFEHFLSRQPQIEAEFGASLEWQRLDGKRACRIRHQVEAGGWRDEARWADVIDASIDAMIRLEKALRGPLKELRASAGANG
jgi:hypothetical protein